LHNKGLGENMDKLITQDKILNFMRMLRVWVVERSMLGPLQYFTSDGLSMGASRIALSEGFFGALPW
jgi:hypothetical protein